MRFVLIIFRLPCLDLGIAKVNSHLALFLLELGLYVVTSIIASLIIIGSSNSSTTTSGGSGRLLLLSLLLLRRSARLLLGGGVGVGVIIILLLPVVVVVVNGGVGLVDDCGALALARGAGAALALALALALAGGAGRVLVGGRGGRAVVLVAAGVCHGSKLLLDGNHHVAAATWVGITGNASELLHINLYRKGSDDVSYTHRKIRDRSREASE
ncbi:hypothetical protein BX600DRAFT_91941 [Xylariales sp. PMI_506]|nr:hypothetical protein BX600DRAFT_91941 [Xylariales sp. PMI_506]